MTELFFSDDISKCSDLKADLTADFKINDYVLLSYDTRLVQTEPLRIFDTPELCTNDDATKNNCDTLKTYSSTSGSSIDLQIFVLQPHPLSFVKAEQMQIVVHPLFFG